MVTKRNKKKNNNRTITLRTQILSQTSQPKKKKRSRRRRTKQSTSPLASIIANPCTGPLYTGVNGSTITERLRTSSTIGAASTTNGYIVWFPSYHNYNAGADTPFNAFYFENASSAALPTNTITSPLGTGASSVTGSIIQDPAGVTLASSSYSRATTISACLQVEYIGALQSISGQVAVIPNISMRAFNSSYSDPAITAVSVDTLFAYAAVRERMQVSGHEVVWRPSTAESVMRTGGSEYNTFTTYQGPRPNTLMTSGTAGSDKSIMTAEASDALGICIAWKGIPAVSNVLSFNMVKVVSLELSPSSGVVQAPFVNPYSTSTTSPFDTITSWLDRNSPNWQAHLMNRARDGIGLLARAYAPRISERLTGGFGLRGTPRIMDL